MIKNSKNKGLALRDSKGFTLIEILVVIGIIAVLAAIVIIAINPARQFAQARATQRTSNVTTLLNAIGQNQADNKGIFICSTGSIPTTVTAVPNPLTSTPAGAKRIARPSVGVGVNDVDLSCITPTYVSNIPLDPDTSTGAHWTSSTDYDTEYYVIQDNSTTGGGRITVFSPKLEAPLSQVNFTAITR